MLNRRTFIAVLVLVGGASCDHPPFIGEKKSLATLEVVFPNSQTASFLANLRSLAQRNGFEFHMRTERSDIGVRHVFEMRRREVWVFGTNPLKDIPSNIPMPANGRPVAPMEIDERRFIIQFFPGDIEPTPTELDEAVNELTATATLTAGVTVSSQHEP